MGLRSGAGEPDPSLYVRFSASCQVSGLAAIAHSSCQGALPREPHSRGSRDVLCNMTARAFRSRPLASQKAGWWDPHEPREPYPPAPMALACAETQQAEQARAALVAAENARLSAVQTSAETEDALPPGHGREDTLACCTARHFTATIRRSGLSRERWDMLMGWTVEKQNRRWSRTCGW